MMFKRRKRCRMTETNVTGRMESGDVAVHVWPINPWAMRAPHAPTLLRVGE